MYQCVRRVGQVITRRMRDTAGMPLTVVLGRGKYFSSILLTSFTNNVCIYVLSTDIVQVSTPASRQGLGSTILGMEKKKYR